MITTVKKTYLNNGHVEYITWEETVNFLWTEIDTATLYKILDRGEVYTSKFATYEKV